MKNILIISFLNLMLCTSYAMEREDKKNDNELRRAAFLMTNCVLQEAYDEHKEQRKRSSYNMNQPNNVLNEIKPDHVKPLIPFVAAGIVVGTEFVFNKVSNFFKKKDVPKQPNYLIHNYIINEANVFICPEEEMPNSVHRVKQIKIDLPKIRKAVVGDLASLDANAKLQEKNKKGIFLKKLINIGDFTSYDHIENKGINYPDLLESEYTHYPSLSKAEDITYPVFVSPNPLDTNIKEAQFLYLGRQKKESIWFEDLVSQKIKYSLYSPVSKYPSLCGLDLIQKAENDSLKKFFTEIADKDLLKKYQFIQQSILLQENLAKKWNDNVFKKSEFHHNINLAPSSKDVYAGLSVANNEEVINSFYRSASRGEFNSYFYKHNNESSYRQANQQMNLVLSLFQKEIDRRLNHFDASDICKVYEG